MTAFWSHACTDVVERAITSAPDSPEARVSCLTRRFGKAETFGGGFPVFRIS